jgi:hypothetical protein
VGRRGLIALTLSAWLAFAGGTAVAAPDDGVHYDPDSPSGQEYALPLDQARDQGGGKGRDAAPFGEGIEPPADSGSTTPGASGSGGDGGGGSGAGGSGNGGADRNGGSGSSGSGGGTGRDGAGSAGGSGSSSTSARPEVTTASVQGTAAQTGLLIALGAVLAAAAAGFAARRFRQRPTA